MNIHDLLKRNSDLAKWWASVVHDDRFEFLSLLVLADLAKAQLPPEELKGATSLLDKLATITDNLDLQTTTPNPGLDHRTIEQILADARQSSPLPSKSLPQ
jgi:hypothetical protein